MISPQHPRYQEYLNLRAQFFDKNRHDKSSGRRYSEKEIDQEILEAYYGRFDRQLFARFMVLKALADIKWSTWAMVQNRLSALDFDFYKYGIWKHMRARSIINDPRWPFFLKAL